MQLRIIISFNKKHKNKTFKIDLNKNYDLYVSDVTSKCVPKSEIFNISPSKVFEII